VVCTHIAVTPNCTYANQFLGITFTSDHLTVK
jgi:hypothetical protein